MSTVGGVGGGVLLPSTTEGALWGPVCRRRPDHPPSPLLPRTWPTDTEPPRSPSALTCCLIALEVDDTHALEAGAALFTPEIDQGEVSIRVPRFL